MGEVKEVAKPQKEENPYQDPQKSERKASSDKKTTFPGEELTKNILSLTKYLRKCKLTKEGNMERIEDKPEGKLMTAIFRESDLNYYPYIVVEEDSEERRIELMTAIQEVLTTLPFRDKKTLELRFGLLDGRPRTLREVGQELSGITRQGARQREAKALRRLRHPIRSGRLKRFIVLSPEEVNDFRKEINYLEGRNQSLDENNQRLKKILKGCGVTEEELEGVRSEDLTSTTQALKKEREGFE